MNQREAIQHIGYLNDTVRLQFLANGETYDDEDTRAALRALGVTDAEIDEAEKG